MARRTRGQALSTDEWTLLIDYYFKKPEPAHTDSHPDCQRFAKLVGLGAQTVDMSLRNIKAYVTGGVGLPKGARRMKELVDDYTDNQPLLRREAREALRRVRFEKPAPLNQALQRLRRLNQRYRSEAAPARRRMVTDFDRPSQVRTDLISIVGTDCQVCTAAAFPTQAGSMYVEAHHLDELARRNPGNLCTENVLIVCPSCHAKLHHAKKLMKSLPADSVLLTLAGIQYQVALNTENRLEQIATSA